TGVVDRHGPSSNACLAAITAASASAAPPSSTVATRVPSAGHLISRFAPVVADVHLPSTNSSGTAHLRRFARLPDVTAITASRLRMPTEPSRDRLSRGHHRRAHLLDAAGQSEAGTGRAHRRDDPPLRVVDRAGHGGQSDLQLVDRDGVATFTDLRELGLQP